jgi:hypothetical protein
MKTLKTYIMFENGKVLESGKYEPEFSARAIAIERAKFFLLDYIRKNKLSGRVTIEVNQDKLHFSCDVQSQKNLNPLIALLNKKHSMIESL